jgi:molecular chaperone GrpE
MDDKKRDMPDERSSGEPELAGEEGGAEEGVPEPPPSVVAGELEELRNRLAYLAAEFDNYRKRVAREKEATVSFGNERLLRSILPFLDNLERAMSQAGSSHSFEGLLSGVRLTYDQFLSELRKFGLEQIPAEGKNFDPNLHEAIAQVPWEGKPEGTVLAEARKGYLLNGRLLRPAQVTVAAPGQGRTPDREDGPDADPAGRGN